MRYEVVYDITREAPPLESIAVGALFMAIGTLLFRFERETASAWRMETTPALRKSFALLFVGAGLLVTIVSGTGIADHFAAQRALRDGRVGTIEGLVEDFHPMPPSGHDSERFTVSGVRFEYSDYVVVTGFHQTSSHGGPVRDGSSVRISYVGPASHPRILRLAMAR